MRRALEHVFKRMRACNCQWCPHAPILKHAVANLFTPVLDAVMLCLQDSMVLLIVL